MLANPVIQESLIAIRKGLTKIELHSMEVESDNREAQIELALKEIQKQTEMAIVYTGA